MKSTFGGDRLEIDIRKNEAYSIETLTPYWTHHYQSNYDGL